MQNSTLRGLLFLAFLFVMATPFILSESEYRQKDIVYYRLHDLQRHYPRRTGDFENSTGTTYTLQIQSIDGGKTWLLLKANERVRGYLRDYFPELDPMRDFEPEK